MIPFHDDVVWDLLYELQPTKEEIRTIVEVCQKYMATHWRDDDSPQSEMTFGVHRKGAV